MEIEGIGGGLDGRTLDIAAQEQYGVVTGEFRVQRRGSDPVCGRQER